MPNFDIDVAPWLLSSMISDLNQTANFTRRGYSEANPLAKPFVEGSSNIGEICLGVAGVAVALNNKIPTWSKAIWAGGHTLAGIYNARHGHERPNIIFPAIRVEW